MTLSIIIINYNTLELTSKCIESVFRFTKNLDFEIILVDNASIECNADIFLEKFPQITLIKSSENVGFSKGNNLGLAIAKGEYILLLNSDTELVEDSISICLEKIKNNPQIGVISPKLIYPNGKIQHIAGRFPSVRYELIELFRLNKILGQKTLMGFYFDHKTETFTDWVWGAFFLTKRNIIDQMPNKKLPDDFFMYFEDVQWCYLIKNLGYKILYFPHTQVIHYVGSSSKLQTLDKNIEKSLFNETTFLIEQKGKIYTQILYFLRSLKYLSLRKKEFREIAYFYWRYLQKLF